MNEEIARTLLTFAEDRVNIELANALSRARTYLEKKVKYKWGSKSEEFLDCSGLITKCYPVVYEGTDKQFEQMRDWLFSGDDLKYIEQGDVVFFAEQSNPSNVSHVGIVYEIENDTAKVIHSSETRGGVVRDDFNIAENVFRDIYIGVAVVKIRPFLFRYFLNNEIMRNLQDVK